MCKAHRCEARAEVSTLSTLVQTPRGRTVVSCVGPTARFDTLKPEFEAVDEADAERACSEAERFVAAIEEALPQLMT